MTHATSPDRDTAALQEFMSAARALSDAFDLRLSEAIFEMVTAGNALLIAVDEIATADLFEHIAARLRSGAAIDPGLKPLADACMAALSEDLRRGTA